MSRAERVQLVNKMKGIVNALAEMEPASPSVKDMRALFEMINEYEAALQFYADPTIYQFDVDSRTHPINLDKGKKANAALGFK